MLTYISAEQFVLVIFVTKYQLLQNDNKNNEPFYTQKGDAKRYIRQYSPLS